MIEPWIITGQDLITNKCEVQALDAKKQISGIEYMLSVDLAARLLGSHVQSQRT